MAAQASLSLHWSQSITAMILINWTGRARQTLYIDPDQTAQSALFTGCLLGPGRMRTFYYSGPRFLAHLSNRLIV